MLIRPAVPQDALAVARVHVRSWQAAYRGLLPAEYLDSLRPEDRAARYDFSHTAPLRPRTIVAEIQQGICGFATTMPSQDLPDRGELCALYLAPEFWGRGVGLALIEAARAHLLEQGFGSAVLWLLKGNVRGERFYRRDGWLPDGACKSDRIWDIDVEDFRYVRPLP
ncbi:GNAT family N-acetyltransferase [Occallatibacter riparius]|uniref:GNAT family N-acetyltransferase n=1 Tax=Occallatibacter riparius TaxID=1002689 RepID=A0A9J7BYJ4_9BACT|nr:GNAT family N-acetyltransferase [Occallatibacter riparius]UWZ86350.1 GNAT family N-acetyltransferase [Occallatibacter riparius]